MSLLDDLKRYERECHAAMLATHKRLGEERTLEAADAFATAAGEWFTAAAVYDREVSTRLQAALGAWQTSAGVAA